MTTNDQQEKARPLKSEAVYVRLTPEQLEFLERQAAAHTEGNLSYALRRLIVEAMEREAT